MYEVHEVHEVHEVNEVHVEYEEQKVLNVRLNPNGEELVVK